MIVVVRPARLRVLILKGSRMRAGSISVILSEPVGGGIRCETTVEKCKRVRLPRFRPSPKIADGQDEVSCMEFGMIDEGSGTCHDTNGDAKLNVPPHKAAREPSWDGKEWVRNKYRIRDQVHSTVLAVNNGVVKNWVRMRQAGGVLCRDLGRDDRDRSSNGQSQLRRCS